MDEQTAQALEKSIKHWEENVERARKDKELLIGPEDCALCDLFFEEECTSCPVSMKTGKKTCYGSPYSNVSHSTTKENRISACIDELNFLKSLREEQYEEKDTNMIDMKKTYTTRNGTPVRLYAVDGGGDYPVHGAVMEDDVWLPISWRTNGSIAYSYEDSCYDLIEAPVTLQMWANVYEDGDSSALHRTKLEATALANVRRQVIACVPVTITYRPGEGLDNDK